MGAGPAEFEPTNPQTPSLGPLEEKVHWLWTAWDLNASFFIRRHVHVTGHCIMTGKKVNPVLNC